MKRTIYVVVQILLVVVGIAIAHHYHAGIVLAMAGSVPLDRLVGQPPILTFAANQQQVSQIDRTGLFDFLKLNLSFTATNAGYSTQPTAVGSNGYEQVLNLIQNITLTATGNAAGATTDTLINTDFLTLGVFQYYYSNGCLPGTPFATFTNAAQNVSAVVKAFFIDPRSNKSTMTRLDARLLSQLQLYVNWRDSTSYAAGGVAGTTTISNGQVVLSVREWQNVPQIIRPWMRISDRKTQIVSQQNALQIQGVPIGNVIRRELIQGIVPAVTGYNYGWSSAAAFASTGQAQGPMYQLLINNSTKVLNESFADLLADNPQLLQITQNAWGTLNGAIPGWYIYEPARQKLVSQSLPMWGINRADNYVDVAAPGSFGSYVKITDQEIVGATAATLA